MKPRFSTKWEQEDYEREQMGLKPLGPSGSGGSGWPTIEQLWQDLLDKDDRTSPAEYPDMALITFDEFRDAILSARNHANCAPQQSAVSGKSEGDA
jgi:hypothetical protein